MAIRFRHSCAFLPLLLAVQLNACNQLQPKEAGPEARPVPNASSEPTEKVTEPVAEKSEGKKQGEPPPLSIARTEPTPPTAPPAPPRKLLSPLPVGDLIGLNREEARKLVGLPRTTSDEPPAVIWEYRHERCVLKLNFYLEVTKKVYRILSTKFEIPDGTRLSEQGCLDAIRSAT